MNMYTSKNSVIKRNYTVKNPKTVLLFIIIECLFIYGVYYFVKNVSSENLQILIFLIVGAIYFFFTVKAEIPGVVIDVENDKFSFPGGGVAAKSFLEYLSPLFWIQHMRRFEYPLSSVLSVAPEVSVNVNKKGDVSRYYSLRVAGTFGSAKIRLDDERKLQELLSLFSTILEMGVPVVKR